MKGAKNNFSSWTRSMCLIQSCFSKQDVPYKSLAHTHEEVFSSYQRKLVFFFWGGVSKNSLKLICRMHFLYSLFLWKQSTITSSNSQDILKIKKVKSHFLQDSRFDDDKRPHWKSSLYKQSVFFVPICLTKPCNILIRYL